MASILIKVLSIGGGVVGTTAIGGSTAYFLSSKPQLITKLLTQNKLKLIDRTKDTAAQWKTKWNPKWTAFKDKYKKNELSNSWKFENWSNLEGQADAPDSFLEKCTNNSKGSVYGVKDILYIEVTTYCTENV